MKKRLIPLLILVLVALLGALLLSACDNSFVAKLYVDGKLYATCANGEVTYDSSATRPSVDGKRFVGWFNEEDESFDLSAYISDGESDDWKGKGEVEFFAKFELINYTVTFMCDGEVLSQAQWNVDNPNVTLPQLPAKQGYNVYWDPAYLKIGKVYRDLTIEACHSLVYYDIAYEGIAEAENATNLVAEYTVEDQVNLPVLTRPGYDFVGWTDENNKAVEHIAHGTVGNKTLTANWKLATYEIAYANLKGNDATDFPTSYKMTDNTIVLPELTAEGYTFAGWYIGNTKYQAIEKGSYGNRMLTAH